MTANDLIVKALLKINAIRSGENPEAAEANSALQELNDMLDAWQTERLMVYAIPRQMFPLTVGQQSYMVGPGGDFNIPRPARIERMGIISLQNPAQPLELPLDYLTESQWAAIPVKQILSSLPVAVWDDQGFPLRTLNFWAIPSVAVETTIYAWTQLGSFQDLFTDYEFPPGYADALKWNLAYRLAPEYGPYMPPTLAGMALEAKAKVKSINHPLLDLRSDNGLLSGGQGQYNWNTDTYAGSQ